MRILLISNSARGHAIGEALARSAHQPEVTVLSTTKNPGFTLLGQTQHVCDIMDFSHVKLLARDAKPDFAFIAPDDPIGAGLADEFAAMGIPSVAPTKALAQIESSKRFTRELMAKHGIDASPLFRSFTRGSSQQEMQSWIENDVRGDYVVKYDALKGGKGVKVSGDHLQSVRDGVAYAQECIAECGQVVIEEKLVGVEFSLMSFVSGTRVAHMPVVQDHKRAFDGDTGPNTGGMGTISDANHSLPFLPNAALERARGINQLVAEALKKECPEHAEGYRGILFGGFMLTRSGVRVIEYNARFGDPEALNVLPLLQTDFVDICRAIIDGSLTQEHVRFANKATVCKYVVPQSYPDAKNEKGQIVTLPHAIPDNIKVYFGDVSQDESGAIRLGGSRAIGIVGIADTLPAAEQAAEQFIQHIKGPVRHRSDIGSVERLMVMGPTV